LAGIASSLPILKSLLAAVFAASLLSTPAPAETGSLEELISAVVKIKTHINPEGRTVQGLGRDREGTGILIDADGLILTIGYLMVEAYCGRGHHQRRAHPPGQYRRL